VGEEAPLLPKWKRNKEGLHAMLTMSFGYAIEVSPLHTLMLYNAVANEGKMMRPYLVSSIKSNGIVVKEILPEVVEEQIAKPEVIKAARQSMEAVVTEGTAKAVFTETPFPVAGKTGTAHVAGGDVKYYHGVYQASFAGYFPADKPEYSCVVVIKTRPHAAMHYGGQLAAPVFKEVATKVYAMYVQKKQLTPVQMPADSSYNYYTGFGADIRKVLEKMSLSYRDSSNKSKWTTVYNNPSKPIVKPASVGEKVIPDVRNMTLKDALYVLENLNVKVSVQGRGKVVAQDIVAGAPVRKNQTITLLLN
jgi:cell division protein FtsI (penicillin-binding protein 3)